MSKSIPKSITIRKKKPVEFSMKDLIAQRIPLVGEVPEKFEEVERYWLQRPYSAAIIVSNDEKGYFYCVFEPVADNKVLESIKMEVLEAVPNFLYEDEEKTLFEAFKHVVSRRMLSVEEASVLWYYLERDILKAGKITPFLHDPEVEDVGCSGYGKPIFVYHSRYENMPTNVVMEEEEVDDFVLTVAQKRGIELSIANPIADTTLHDGSRIQLTFRSEVTDHGSTFSVRKIRRNPITPLQLIKWGTFSAEEIAFLWLCLESNSSMLFAGGTAGGKTTAMNAIALFIPPNAKIVSIEDTREIILLHKNWIPSVARSADMFSLLKVALRQRPEYIIVGEVRGKEVEVMFQAMSLGHTCLSTMHGGSAKAVVDRITSPPYSVPKTMLPFLDLIILMGKYSISKKVVRRCAGIWDMGEDPDSKDFLRQIFRWDSSKDAHIQSKLPFEKIAVRKGLNMKEVEKEFDKRVRLLKHLVESGADFIDAVSKYHFSPDAVVGGE